jgi:peptidoglycan L-alanyl-D-glutamate endopeptidase CwlK
MPSDHSRDTKLDHLHPTVRSAAQQVLQRAAAEGHPFELFEAFRTPQRQNYLWAQGRTRPGPIVTRAKPWSSYHQYGLAVDLVLRINGQWSWTTSGQYADSWERMNELGRNAGLEPLSWELPHLQMAGLKISELRGGDYPAGGDDSWAENLEAAIAGWAGTPAPPPPPEQLPIRPAIAHADTDAPAGSSFLEANSVPPVGSAGWHNKFDGRDWRYDENGVYARDINYGDRPLRSPGSPVTCRAIWTLFGTVIMLMARKYDIAPEVIIMTIATEAAAYRSQGFTGPATFRWEAHVWNRDVEPATQGDYSAGPMQTLGTTARWVIEAQDLSFHKFQVAPVFPVRPTPPPSAHSLYDPATNIEIGAAEIRQRITVTGQDPILIAAAFNSGGVYPGDTNAWHLRSHGNHLDRAAQWFGDACAVLKEAGVR